MAIIASDGLRLLVGDGGSPSETFNALKGALIHRLEINQRAVAGNSIDSTAWQRITGCTNRSVTLECEALANDEAAAVRLRELAMGGTSGNVRLELKTGQRIDMEIYVSRYSESIQPGNIKRLECRLESSGVSVLVG